MAGLAGTCCCVWRGGPDLEGGLPVIGAEQHIELLETAEASVLGCSLSDEANCAIAVSRLSEADFRREAHRLLFRAIASVQRKGGHGVVDVTSWLIDAGKADEVTPSDVSRLGGMHLPRATFEQRVRKLESAAARRVTREAALRLARACEDWQNTDEELTRLTHETLMDVQLGRNVGSVVSLADRREGVGRHLSGDHPVRAVSTGWPNVDEFYKVTPGRWTLVGGIGGHGKSSWLDALTVNLAEQHGWKFLVCSPEKQPVELHMAQLAQQLANRRLLGQPGKVNDPDVAVALDRVNDHWKWMELGDSGRDVPSVLSMARLEHAMNPFQGMIVDPWNELTHTRPANMTETEHISESLTRIRSFARQLDVHVWLVAHPTKMKKDADGAYMVPTPYDVAGSHHWSDKADCAVTIYRDKRQEHAPTEVYVQKVRWQPEDGQEGMTLLRFDTSTGRFYRESQV